MAVIRARSRITGKGQVQIPKKIRESAGVKIGDEASFTLTEEGNLEIEFIKKRPLTDFAGILPVKKPYPGLEEETALTKQLVAEKAAKDYE